MNLEGGFKNETAGLAPGKWELEPLGNNMTCVDAKAFIREGAPDFTSRRDHDSDLLWLLLSDRA
jgi:hypothetical protein